MNWLLFRITEIVAAFIGNKGSDSVAALSGNEH
jgi:hypothetical protein